MDPQPLQDNKLPKTLFLLSERTKPTNSIYEADQEEAGTCQGKSPQEDVRGVIYSIPCEFGAVYIGETECNLKIRLTEYQWPVCNKDYNNSIAVHTIKTHHDIKWEEARVVTVEPHLTKRKVKEPLIIQRTNNSMNLDSVIQLDSVWCYSSLPASSHPISHQLSTHTLYLVLSDLL